MVNSVASKKKYIVSGNIVSEAHRCIRTHACVKDPEFELCSIGFCDVDRYSCVLLCEDKSIGSCPYQSNLGNRRVCTCPVRQEIFRKYGD